MTATNRLCPAIQAKWAVDESFRSLPETANYDDGNHSLADIAPTVRCEFPLGHDGKHSFEADLPEGEARAVVVLAGEFEEYNPV